MTPFLFLFNIGFFLYAFLCTLAGFFYKVPDSFFKEELYWPLAFAALLFLFFYKEKKFLSSFSMAVFCKKNADTFLVFVLVLILRICLFDQVELWVDEDYQAYSSIIHRALIAGVWQHQPPLDMVFTKIGTLLSNESLWGLRLHAVLFSSLASALLYDQVKKFSDSKFIAALSTLFFSLHLIVIRYGYEARPISLGLLSCISFLGVYLSLLAEKENSFFNKTPVFNCLITFLFLNALGMQPVILTGTALGFLLLYYLNQNSWFRRHLLSLAAGFVLFLPLQIYILKYSPPRFTKQAGFNLPAFWEELLRYENFSIIKSYYWPLGCFFIAFCIAYFAYLAFKQRPAPASLLFLFALVTAFPLFLVPFFKSHVSWTMNIQYFALIIPVVFFGVAFMLRSVFDFFSLRDIRRNASVAVFFIVASFFFDWGPLTHLEKTYKQFEIKKGFQILNEQSTDRDIDLVFCLNASGWCPNNFILQSFHYKKSLGGLAYGWENPVFNNYLKALDSGFIPENIYFIYYSVWSNKQLADETPYRIAHLFGLDLLKVPVQNHNLPQTIIDFCKPWVDQGMTENVLYVQPVEYIVASASALGKTELRNHYLRLYKDFTGKKTDSNYLNGLLK